MLTATRNVHNQEVFQGKWGFYPCDYETFRKLKRLNFFAQLDRRLEAQHERWARKLPQNRFLRTKTKLPDGKAVKGWALDAKGNRIPWQEPLVTPSSYASDFIEELYRRARFPVATADEVKPLMITGKEIDDELATLEKWYAKVFGVSL